MRYLGIDYGTKKIGIAISDELGAIAFPKIILENNDSLLKEISALVQTYHIESFVVGKSLDMDGSENRLQKDIEKFSSLLETEFSLPVFMEIEWMSSVAARSHLYGKGNIANKQWSGRENKKKRDPVDAMAAAVILQRFLDKKNR